jgi:4-amino-4-deoxy-L-arabinose transferase-like glycosyltransferase
MYPMSSARPPLAWPWLLLVFAAAALYLLGLGSPYAPTNGDEMVYIHIARMTSEAGHWLPLQSELLGTRNTKPPLLIWQAMVAGDWGHHWHLFALRLPSVAYTLATTALLAWFARRISGQWRTALIAAALYLLFFSSFRYGRAYLTSAPETFWLALPMWWVLHLKLHPVSRFLATPSGPGFLTYTLFGVVMGLGAAYKSFALLAPAAAATWFALLLGTPWSWRTAWRTSLGLGWSTLLGLGIFALWFALDPDPNAVWQEFVVAENAGKMSGGMGYWHAALYGAYPMWTQLFAFPENAGLLALPVLGFCLLALLRAVRPDTYARLQPAHWVLLAWLLVWLVVFTIPSQRSARYVIPAMPALAIAMALVWDRLPRLWFWLTLLIVAPALLMLGRISWVMGEMGMASQPEVALTLLAAGAGGLCVIAGLLYKHWARSAALGACLAVYASFGLMVAPISGGNADYNPALQAQLKGQRVAVPNGFTGQYERFHFLLPGARITPYDAEGRNTGALYPDMPDAQRLSRLLSEFDAVVWLQDEQGSAPSCLPACTLLGQRWHVKSRHKSGEVTLDNIWQPQDWLFRREWLLAPPSKPAATPAQ